jgi:hypothetical protein
MWPEWYGDSLQRPLIASSHRVPDTYALYLANARGPADLRMRMWGDGGAGFALSVEVQFASRQARSRRQRKQSTAANSSSNYALMI